MISPFIYAYFMKFLCYNELGQHDNRFDALVELVGTAGDDQYYSRTSMAHVKYNIIGYCFIISGLTEMARMLFIKSTEISHSTAWSFMDKYNSAYHYLLYM